MANNLKRIFSICVVMSVIRLTAQSDTSRWAFSIRANVYWPVKQPLLEDFTMKFRPAPSWEVNLSYDFFRSSRVTWMASYQHGSLPLWFRVRVPGGYHSDIPYELDFGFYYAQHPYNSLGVGTRWIIGKQSFSVQVSNRFYSSSHSGTGVTVHLQPGQRVRVFKADANFWGQYLCPQIVGGLTGCIWNRFPSWNYEVNIAFVPVPVVMGTFVFFPDDPTLKLQHDFRIPQSNFSFGLFYRRVKKPRDN